MLRPRGARLRGNFRPTLAREARPFKPPALSGRSSRSRLAKRRPQPGRPTMLNVAILDDYVRLGSPRPIVAAPAGSKVTVFDPAPTEEEAARELRPSTCSAPCASGWLSRARYRAASEPEADRDHRPAPRQPRPAAATDQRGGGAHAVRGRRRPAQRSRHAGLTWGLMIATVRHIAQEDAGSPRRLAEFGRHGARRQDARTARLATHR